MAEAVVGVVIEQLVSAATEWAMDEISMIRGVETELDNMSTKMTLIQKVLDDAENRSVKSKKGVEKELVQIWLDNLQDLSYQMEDVLDEWSTIVNMHKLEAERNNASSSCKLTCLTLKQFNCFNYGKQVGWRRDIASRIKIINGKVDLIFDQMDQFKFMPTNVERVVPDAFTMNNSDAWPMNNSEIDRVTTSLVNKSLIHGRDAEKETLIRKLLGENNEQGGHLDVVSIVGLGGLGKTTLAQLVYNDERVIQNFEKRIWVCVSNTFNGCKVAKGILEGLNVSHVGKDELQTLHMSIESSLSNHKFLLVLDDVWNEEVEKWQRLRACLETGATGSRVLITTRSDKVARIMGTTKANMFRPELISKYDCWLLMSHVAFESKHKDDVHKFENIGKEIAKKCKGLPLAAKTLGGLLILKDTVEEWREVLNSEIWELEQAETQLFPHLFLSYRELPSTLKRCFLFFSIFPKDHQIQVDELIKLWIANGYINPTKQIYNLEHVGREYFRYLLSRSFFFEVPDRWSSSSIVKTSMHDIMHDFALHISRDNFLTITKDDNNPEPTSPKHHMKAHHLSIEGRNSFDVCDVGRLRTFWAKRITQAVTLDMLRHLKLVRTLQLIGCGLDQIPQEIGKLIHLRTLDLSWNQSLNELPETIGDLYNLKYLVAKYAGVKKLPESIAKLINLRDFSTSCYASESLSHESLGKLVNLQKLHGVRVDDARSRGLGFLKNLNQLREGLKIVFDSDYVDDVDANEAKLKSKKYLRELAFDFNGKDVAEVVVDALEPSTEIKVLEIVGFKGTRLPSWITSLNNLTELKVSSAENIVSLPPLGKLPCLIKLKISELSTLKFIGRDFLGIIDKNISFPALEELELSGLDQLEEWEDLKVEEEDMTNAMPELKILTIQGCPKLEEMPLRLLSKALPFLKKLNVDKIELPSNIRFTGEEVAEGTFGTLLPPFHNLQDLWILNHMGPELPTWIACLNYLTDLDLDGAAEVQSLPPLGKLPFLERLSIEAFSSLDVIGREFLGIGIENKVTTSSAAATPVSSSSSIAYFPKLVDLSLRDLDELKEWEDITVEEEDTNVNVMPNLRSLLIYRCPSLVVLPHRLFHKAALLQSLELEDDERRVLKSSSSSFEAVFGTMVTAIPKLQDLSIREFMEPVLPSWITSLNYLTDLYLRDSEHVTSLPPLGKLPCLKELTISNLSVLKLVGHGFLGIEDDNIQKSIITTSITSFPKLEILRIYGCGQLEAWEDIKAEDEDDAITLMPNLILLYIERCPKLEVLPHRLLRRASSLGSIYIRECGIAVKEKIVEDAELLLRVQEVEFNGENLKEKKEKEDN